MDIRTATINELVKVVCSRIRRFNGIILSFKFWIDSQQFEVSNGVELRRLLLQIFSHKIIVVKVVVTTPLKLFSEWKLSEVLELYGLGDKVDQFQCCHEPANSCISDLIASLKEAYSTTPLTQYTEATKSIYTWIIVSKIVAVFNSTFDQPSFKTTPHDPIEGPYGKRPVDYSTKILATGTVVRITEVKREDIEAGIAQNMVQLESVMTGTKRKAVEMEDMEETDVGKGIRMRRDP